MRERPSHCPTCRSKVIVVMADDGTSHYEPFRYGQAIKRLADDLQVTVEAVRAHRDRWYAVNSQNPDEARPADRELWAAALGSDLPSEP